MGIDLIKIKEIAKEKEDENWTFRTFLKRHDMPLDIARSEATKQSPDFKQLQPMRLLRYATRRKRLRCASQ